MPKANERELEDSNAEFDEVFDEAVGEKDEEKEKNDDSLNEEEGKDKEAEAARLAEEEAARLKAEEEAKAKKGEEETYEQRWKTLQGIYRHEKEEWENQRNKLVADLEASKKPPEEKEKKPSIPAALYDSLSPEEKAEFEEYDSEFDVISKMEGKKRNLEYNKLRKEFEDRLTEIVSQLAEAKESGKVATQKVESLADLRLEEEHFNKIREKHSDFEKFRDDGSIEKWIKSKPKYMQGKLTEVYESGGTDEVIEFLDDFKKENGVDAERVPDPNRKKMEKKDAMRSVTSRRGSVNPSIAPAEDYESAYEEAISKGG